MKEIFDWLREQMEKVKSEVYSPADVIWNNAVKMCMREVNEAEAKWEAERATTEAEIRAKAIDEFAEKLKWELGQLIFPDSEKFAHPVREQEQICYQNMTLKRAIRLVDYFAEQLKEE